MKRTTNRRAPRAQARTKTTVGRGRDWRASSPPAAVVKPAALDLFQRAAGHRSTAYGHAIEWMLRIIYGPTSQLADLRAYLTAAQYRTYQREKRNAARYGDRLIASDERKQSGAR